MNYISKKSVFLFFVTLLAFPVMAQVGELRNNFAVGVNAGFNYSKLSFSPTIKQSGLVGPAGGITARYISEKYFAMICGIQVELNYVQRGWKELIEDGTEDTYSRTMNYLEIPFLAHLAFGKERGGRFFINLGPQIAFLLGENEKFSESWTPGGRRNEQYGKMAENKFDYGIVGGLGVEIRTKAGNFLVEGRYYFGLSDVFNSTKKDYFSRSAHSTILARVSYLFDLTK